MVTGTMIVGHTRQTPYGTLRAVGSVQPVRRRKGWKDSEPWPQNTVLGQLVGRLRTPEDRLCPSAAVVFLAVLAACGASSPRPRPATNAKLIIISPTPNEVTGPNVTLQFEVIGGTVLPAAQARGPLRGDQGHIHVSLDSQLVQMAYTTHAELTGLSPGVHTVLAAWVAVDHLPFRNQVIAAVLFRVAR